jgi:uncharacterized membrane protein
MKYALYVIAAFEVLAALMAVGRIGKTPKPFTPAAAVGAVVICAAITVTLILAAGELH